ncbi:MAG: VCBS repeat-containing protein [Chthonomonadales bacterium]
MNSPVQFKEHFVGSLPDAYQVTVADVNGDGKPDIVGLSSGRSEIVWFENPIWKRHVITTHTKRNIDIALYDIDGKGELAAAVASEFDLGNSKDGGRLQIFRRGKPLDTEWVGMDFDTVISSHRIRWADLNGDGHKELVVVPLFGEGAKAPDYTIPMPLVSYSFEDGKAHRHDIDRSLTMAHGVKILDWYGKGHDDILIASFEGVTLYSQTGKGADRKWQKTHLGVGEQNEPTKRGSSEVDRGWLPGKKPFIATIEPWHGHEVVVYLQPKETGALWERHVIDNTLNDGHGIACVDLDGDGKFEIIAGYRGGEHNLYGYRCLDIRGEKWERFTIDAGNMAGSAVKIADINGDGRPDIVACGSVTGNVKWYENLGPIKK